MNIELQNAEWRAVLNTVGAELQSLRQGAQEWIWQADPQWWGRHSPVLFPVVGGCRGDRINVDDRDYPMPRHGFARDLEFTVFTKNPHTALFRLFDTGASLQQFPFPFELSIEYTLQKTGLHIRYEVFNPGNRTLPFALGAHPAFRLPPQGMEGLHLRFDRTESFERHLLENGLFNGKTQTLGEGTILALNPRWFEQDAVIFKGLSSRKLELSNGKDYSLLLEFDGFEDFGIWTPAGCQEFLCLEPWYGYADSVRGPDEFSRRNGIHLLEPGKTWEGFWKLVDSHQSSVDSRQSSVVSTLTFSKV